MGLNLNLDREVIIFSSIHDNEVGWLAKVLKHFEDNCVNLLRIESRYSTRIPGHLDFIVECKSSSSSKIENAIQKLHDECDWLNVISKDSDVNKGKTNFIYFF